ncbi:MAG: FAD/NAD(P)-binding protein [Bdellovibrionota bacterium]
MRLIIVGAGYCGTMLAAQLLRRSSASLDITLVEQSGRYGPGIAYHPGDDELILNVVAERMGASPADIGEFQRWCVESGAKRNAKPGEFLPRSLYALYLTSLLRDAQSRASAACRLKLLSAEVVDAHSDPTGAHVRLRNGDVLDAQAVVFALGNLPARRAFPELPESHFTFDPWRATGWRSILPTRTVLVIGSGLTAVDILSSLIRSGHQGPLLCVSRHGLMSRVRVDPPEQVAVNAERFLRCRTMRDVVATFREEVDRIGNWQSAVDTLRPHIPTIWRKLPSDEQKRFLRHLASIWNAYCHRMPQQTAELISKGVAAKQLQITAGRVLSAELVEGRVRATVLRRGSAAPEDILVDHIVDCRGSPDNPRKVDSDLIRSLLASEQIAVHPSGVGLACDESGYRLLNPATGQSRFYVLGNALRGERWESTAVPQLRGQTVELADLLLRSSERALS